MPQLFVSSSPTLVRSRSSTGRSAARPLGRPNQECVATANSMVGRVLILLMICQALGAWWLLEQPASSIMHCHPLFQQVLKLPGLKVRRLYTCMGWFGGPTKKPTHLYSSAFLALAKCFIVLSFRKRFFSETLKSPTCCLFGTVRPRRGRRAEPACQEAESAQAQSGGADDAPLPGWERGAASTGWKRSQAIPALSWPVLWPTTHRTCLGLLGVFEN